MSARICFISCHYFGLQALLGLLESRECNERRIEISLLVTLEESKASSTVGFHNFEPMAREYGLEHLRVCTIKDEAAVQLVKAAKPDYLLIIGWSELAPPMMLDVPGIVNSTPKRHAAAHGCIGMHPTLLPEGRGRAPIPWAIIKGLTETGVTAFLLENTADCGGIVAQQHIPVESRETATSLFQKCAVAHAELARRLAPTFANRALSWVDQDLSRGSVWPKRRPGDGLIDFSASTQEIDRLVRALMPPYPGAFLYYGGRKLRVGDIRIIHAPPGAPSGTIVGIGGQGAPQIAASDGIVECVVEPSDDLVNFRIGANVSECHTT